MLTSKLRAAALVLALLGLGVSVPVCAGAFPLQVLRRVPVAAPGTPRALVFAPDGKRAYLAVGRRELPGRVVDLASAAGGDRAYAALRDPAAIAVLSLQPLRVLRTWRLPVAPSALLAGAGGHALYVESAASDRVLELDAASGRTLGSTHLDGQLQQMAANGYGHLFIAVADRDVVDVIDTRTLRLAGTFPVPCRAPTGLAMDPVGRRLFVSCAGGGVAVIDTDIGYTFQQLPAAAGSARALFVFHPDGKAGWKGAAFFASARGIEGQHLGAGRQGQRPALGVADEGQHAHRAQHAARGQLWVALPKSAAGAKAAASAMLILGTAPAPGVHP